MSRSTKVVERVPADLDSALATMSAESLREIVREVVLELDERAHARVVASLIARAARSDVGWTPAPVTADQVAEALAFVKTAELWGHADPAEVDEYLRLGSASFLRKDYASAHCIFGALLPPIGVCKIDLGQHELVNDVLGADVDECANQYVVAVYMLTPQAERANAVREAIDQVRCVGYFWEPLRALERAAVEPLPDLAEFLPAWRTLLASTAAREGIVDEETEAHRWLREVVQRIEGADGLATIARTTKRFEDLRAWCHHLVDDGDWPAALKAFGEAADFVSGKHSMRGDFLDGAALAAQRLSRKDLAAYLERAWRASPTMPRLRRWLGASRTKASLSKRVDAALPTCPTRSPAQRALLHILSHDFVAAANVLASAPGLGWSDDDHPGHLLFGLFAQLLTASNPPARRNLETLSPRGAGHDDLEAIAAESGWPHLATLRIPAHLGTWSGVSGHLVRCTWAVGAERPCSERS